MSQCLPLAFVDGHCVCKANGKLLSLYFIRKSCIKWSETGGMVHILLINQCLHASCEVIAMRGMNARCPLWSPIITVASMTCGEQRSTNICVPLQSPFERSKLRSSIISAQIFNCSLCGGQPLGSSLLRYSIRMIFAPAGFVMASALRKI